MTAKFNNQRVWGPEPRYPNVLAYPKQSNDMIVIAGPCSIENVEQVEVIAKELKRVGCTYMRGGVYRAGTYPPETFGLQRDLLFDWAKIAHKHGLKIIVDVLDIRLVDLIDKVADAFQVGARQMQNYALLRELSKTTKPVTLKRHPGATIDEFLGAAEYLAQGRCTPILIERGSATHMNHVRWSLDVSVIAAVKEMCNVRILVDASHGSGRRDLVSPLTMAGITCGADGFLVEVHPDPDKSLSDAPQAYPLEDFAALYTAALNHHIVRRIK